MNRKAVSRPVLGDLQHHFYWQTQEKVPQANAAWGKPHVSLPGLRRMCILGKHRGDLRPQSGALLGARP
mgnify:CR=1 FL=1